MSNKKELTQKEFSQTLVDLNEFDENFYSILAETDKFEIIPAVDEDGQTLSKEQLSAVRRECYRLGFKVLYKIDRIVDIMYINPETMKTGIVTDGVH